MKNEGKRDHTREEMINLGRNPSGIEVQREEKVIGSEKTSFCRGRMRVMKFEIASKLFKENASRWIEDLSRFCRALILNR